jgi:hypothetical protein
VDHYTNTKRESSYSKGRMQVASGAGARPSPFLRHHKLYSHSIKTFSPWFTRNTEGGLVTRPCQVTLPGPKVMGSNPVESQTILPLQPMEGCHMAAQDWATWHHVIRPKYATCQTRIRPPVKNICPISMSLLCHVTCTVVRHVHSASMSALYGLHSDKIFCMFGKTNRP